MQSGLLHLVNTHLINHLLALEKYGDHVEETRQDVRADNHVEEKLEGRDVRRVQRGAAAQARNQWPGPRQAQDFQHAEERGDVVEAAQTARAPAATADQQPRQKVPLDRREQVDREAAGEICPGRKPPFSAVARPARLYKSTIQNRFTVGNAKRRLDAPGRPGQCFAMRALSVTSM